MPPPAPRPQPRGAPGPWSLPLLGSARQTRSRDSLRHFGKLWRKYGDVVRLRTGSPKTFLLAHPEHVHHVLVKNHQSYVRGAAYDGLRSLMEHGLITSDGELWRIQRRLMRPSFAPVAITRFTDMMVEVTHRLLERWQAAAARHEPIHMDAEAMRLTMSALGRAIFSLDLGEELAEVGRAFQGVFTFISERSVQPVQLPLSVPLPRHIHFLGDMAVIDRFITERLEERRRRDEADDLLAVLLRARDKETGQPMGEQQLRDELIALFFAGFESTARSLTWSWYLLSRHPEVVRRLELEVDEVLQGEAPSVEDLPHLKYTRMVVDETLRLYPPTAMLSRRSIAEDEIGGYPIPAGSLLLPAIYLVHRHPSAWTHPERFDPERFTPEAVEARPEHAYLPFPFSSGPRNCLGSDFALLEMVVVLAMTASRFRLESMSGKELTPKLVGATRPARPLWMMVYPRAERRIHPPWGMLWQGESPAYLG